MSPEELGRIVRDEWMRWAREQPDLEQRPDWLTPWEELPQRIRDVDTRIGMAVAAVAADHTMAVMQKLLGTLSFWSSTYGKELCPGTKPDTYGEGVRACKKQVEAICLRAAKEYEGGR